LSRQRLIFDRQGGDVSVRFIMVVSVPTEAGNQLMKDPSGVKTLEAYLNTVKPEAAYFSELYGERVFFIVLDLPAPDAIPVVAEPLFKLGARVGFHVAMTLDDLKKAFQKIS
jgi:hypothetical protein